MCVFSWNVLCKDLDAVWRGAPDCIFGPARTVTAGLSFGKTAGLKGWDQVLLKDEIKYFSTPNIRLPMTL